MSGLARMAKLYGKTVAGSELKDSATLRELRQEGIIVYPTQIAKQVPLDYDLYVYSSAVPEDNPERQVLAQHHLESKCLTYFQAVGEFMKVYTHRIAVSGTHGKTTTTAMLASVLTEAGLDPTAIVGSTVKAWDSNVRAGKSLEYFVVEACEYQAHMLELHPSAIILTNIEEDHLDYYTDLNHIHRTFQKYINQLPSAGVLIRNADDSECRELGFDGHTVSYSIEEPADVTATNIQKNGHQQIFMVNGQSYTINVPGDFNIYNALAVIAYALYCKIPYQHISAGLQKFNGTKRRFEHIGQYKGADVISDYAHHPTAVTGLLHAAKEWYPNRRIVIVFQPHQHNRTKRLFESFTTAFDEADLIILQEIYDVAGREAGADQDVSAQDLAQAIEATGKLVIFSPDQDKTKQLLAEHVEKNDVLLIVGAGDVYTLAEDITAKEASQ